MVLPICKWSNWQRKVLRLGVMCHKQEGDQDGAHERPRESGSFRMSAMTLFWYLGPIATIAAMRLAQYVTHPVGLSTAVLSVFR